MKWYHLLISSKNNKVNMFLSINTTDSIFDLYTFLNICRGRLSYVHLFKMPTLLWCHGGAFGGGNATYDKKLRDDISKLGINVVSIEFCLDNIEKALQQVKDECKQYMSHDNVVVGGISSGGYIAHMVADAMNLNAFLIAPVFKPASRHLDLSPKLQKLQLKAFHSLENMKKYENMVRSPTTRRIIVYGSKDTRAENQSYSTWENTKRFKTDKDHVSLCKNPPQEAVEWIKELFH